MKESGLGLGRSGILWAVLVVALFMGGFRVEAAYVSDSTKQKPSGTRQTRQEAVEEMQKNILEEAEKKGGGTAAESPSLTSSQLLLEKQQAELEGATPEEEKAIKEELKRLERELLRFPKRDRFSFGGDFDMTYDSNIDRRVIRSEKEDTFFRVVPFVQFDLGGRQTDLKAEFRANKQYYVKVPEGKDSFSLEGNLRAGRKIGKRTALSINERLTYTSRRDAEIDDDGKKIQWDNSARGSLNYELNRKFSFNLEVDHSTTQFPHELFDQDGTYSVNIDPNLFFQLTPKTRLSAGYRWGVTRPKVEGSDKTTHEFRWGYFGRLTKKSSIQVDLSWTLDDPDTAQAARSKQFSTSLGYVWQATPKTSLRALYSNSVTHSISDSLSGIDLLKTTSRSASDTFSLSTRFRLNRKLSAELSSDFSHSHSKTKKTGSDNTRSRTWTFPFQVATDYQLVKWMRLRLTYTYRHRIGDEESDENRAHTWFFGSNVSF